MIYRISHLNEKYTLLLHSFFTPTDIVFFSFKLYLTHAVLAAYYSCQQPLKCFYSIAREPKRLSLPETS